MKIYIALFAVKMIIIISKIADNQNPPYDIEFDKVRAEVNTELGEITVRVGNTSVRIVQKQALQIPKIDIYRLAKDCSGKCAAAVISNDKEIAEFNKLQNPKFYSSRRFKRTANVEDSGGVMIWIEQHDGWKCNVLKDYVEKSKKNRISCLIGDINVHTLVQGVVLVYMLHWFAFFVSLSDIKPYVCIFRAIFKVLLFVFNLIFTGINCSKCGDGVIYFVKCGRCQGCFHFKCAGVSGSSYCRKDASARAAWRCRQCRNVPIAEANLADLVKEIKALNDSIITVRNDIQTCQQLQRTLTKWNHLETHGPYR